MTKRNNAAIWYVVDGYDPIAKGMNGRRVAGQSFLNGFFRHADVDQFTCVGMNKKGIERFCYLAKRSNRGIPAEGLLYSNYKKVCDIGTVFYPGPTFSKEAWRRFQINQTAFSLCGIAHTTATNRAMQGIYDLRIAPIEAWDALICTSNSLRKSVEEHFDHVDAYLERRTGTTPPPRPMLPVIPLGIHADDFEIPEDLGFDLRKKLNISATTRVCMVMCRLSAVEKFDPLPMYQALSMAQKDYGGDMALILCGYFPETFEEKIFLNGAKALMPNVALHVVDGKDPEAKRAAFSASDIFLFPIDNIQETFGIAPLEGMAAGLPIVCSDWDGMRDTVTEDVGFRIPTIMGGAATARVESYLHMTGLESYSKFLARLSFKTSIDVPQMAEKIALLAKDPDLARSMGQAGRDRVRKYYDWSAIIPQMQDLWAEQEHIRKAAEQGAASRYKGLFSPIAPPATQLFAGYPTQSGLSTKDQFYAVDSDLDAAKAKIKECVELRIFPKLNNISPNINRILSEVVAADDPISADILAEELKLRQSEIEQVLILLLKYDVLRRV